MTNEELAELIREGNDGLIPQLWEQVQVYVRRKAGVCPKFCVNAEMRCK